MLDCLFDHIRRESQTADNFSVFLINQPGKFEVKRRKDVIIKVKTFKSTLQ